LGYDIEKIYAKLAGKKEALYIKEKNLTNDLIQSQLSQGMFRALSLIVFIYYLINKNTVRTIIVDDLCEGLDYDRATKLGQLLFEELENKKIQLIASSNDSFLMDVVNIKYWNILTRKNNTIKVYNYKNSQEKFDQFKYSGLSNFDLFSSDYLDE
jgi:predicted ATPase